MYVKYNSFRVLNKVDELKETVNFLVQILSGIAEFRDLQSDDPAIRYHIDRIQAYTRIMCEEMSHLYPECGISDKRTIDLIVMASALHDIGKVAIPDYILTKEGKLTSEEFSEVKNHTRYGAEILESFVTTRDSFYRYARDICLYHHERYDGRGYPEGLSGDSIPIWSQIVGIADVYDALVNKKVYRGAYGRKKAEEMILGGACGAFSDKILSTFDAAKDRFAAINEYGDATESL